MVTLIHKLRHGRAYQLDISIPIKGGAEKAVTATGAGGIAVQSERVLTLGASECRCDLPDVILESKAIKSAIAAKWVAVKKQKVSQPANTVAKPSKKAASKSKKES